MELTKIRNSNLIIFGIPLLLIAFLVLFSYTAFFDRHSAQLSIALTLDFILTIPILYLFLIRKSNIDKKTVVPFFIGGIIIATFVIPQENQGLLETVKTWVVPLVEITVITLIVLNVRKALEIYKVKKENSFDLLTNIRATCTTVFPKHFANFLAIEITSFYYGFIHWKKIKPTKNEFTYHKNTGSQSLLIAVIILIAIETVAFHALLNRWSATAAWILTGISIYSAFQIFGFLRSLSKRPIIIERDILKLYYGIMGETTIEINNIAAIELTSKPFDSDQKVTYLSFLGEAEGHNIVIHLNKENTLIGLYGTKKKYRSIALFIDEKEKFKNTLETKI